MKLDADNPMLTAYALGELDEPQRAEIEAQLEHDEAARKLVDEIRASAVMVTQELKSERTAGLDDAAHAKIFERHSAPTAKKFVYWKPMLAAAALLFVVCTVALTTMVQRRAPLALRKGSNAPVPNQSFVQSTPAAAKASGSAEAHSDEITGGYKPALAPLSTPQSAESKDLRVPKEVLAEAELGDRFETINLDKTQNEFRNAAGGGGVGGHADVGTATGTFGDPKKKEIGIGYAMPKTPTDHLVKNTGNVNQGEKKPEPATRPSVAVGSNAIDAQKEFETRVKELKERLENESAYEKALGHYEPAKGVIKTPPYGGVGNGVKVSGVDTGTIDIRDSKIPKEELEKLKRDIAELREKARNLKGKELEAFNREVESRYGPNGKLPISGVVDVGGYKLEEKNGFKKTPDLSERTEPGYIATPNPQPAPAPGESYPALVETGFKRVTDEPLSTFSIDVDTASYANVRRFLGQGQLPPRDAVRIEEMLNYFSYNYGQPQGDDPFAIHVEVAQCPWNTGHRLARVGIKGREFPENKRPAGNYVFLIDVSGSMDEPKKRPLVQAGLNMLVDKLGDNDRVGIVTYAGEAAVSLPSTACSDKQRIKNVINSLRAAGSTNGGDGIQRAYKMATENFMKGGINRVILCTDGDFNVGVTNQNDLVNLIEAQAKSGVFLSVLGFGMGNLKDATMQKLADKGNGNYAYIDSLDEVRKVLVDQMMATLATIAKDVKIQVEFNPAKAGAYRLIGYEKRLLNKQDFNNDKVDAGEVGAGHQVTALYEIVPAGALESEPGVDPLIYQKNPEPKPAPGASNDLLTLKIRYKPHDGDTSKLIKGAVADSGASYSQASKDFKFAAAVAAFGMLLRESPYRGNTSLDAVLELADEARGKDEGGYRREFLSLVEKAKALMKR